MKPGISLRTTTDRTAYFDYLKIAASFAVMILHISAQNWYTADVNGFEWQIYNLFNSAVRWAVPVFVMISGALFLGRDISLSVIFSKYVLRMAVSFVVWSFIYALFIDGSLSDRMAAFIVGHYHMWFIFMISGLYVCLPLLWPIAESRNRSRYFIILFLVFACAVPEILTIAGDTGIGLLVRGAQAAGQVLTNMNMQLVMGYAGYFVLGYYMHKTVLDKRQRILIYILGMFGFIITAGLTLLISLRNQNYCDHYYGYFSVNVLFEALAVFVWFKYRRFNKDRLNCFAKRMARYSFGAYLIHALVIEQLWGGGTGLKYSIFSPPALNHKYGDCDVHYFFCCVCFIEPDSHYQ